MRAAAGRVVLAARRLVRRRAARVHPHYLAYFNEPAGGPRDGYRRLVDSSLDWGQDLTGLSDWMERAGSRA